MRKYSEERVRAEALAARFEGLPPGFSHWELCDHVANAREPLGLDSDGVCLLQFYLKRSKAQDWERGAEPILAWPKFEICFYMGWSEDKLSRVEAKLCAAGLIAFRDGPNCKRRAYRDRDGRVCAGATGISLAPMGARALEIACLASEALAAGNRLRGIYGELFSLRAELISLLTAASAPEQAREQVRQLIEEMPRRRVVQATVEVLQRLVGRARAAKDALAALLEIPSAPLSGRDEPAAYVGTAPPRRLHRKDAAQEQPDHNHPEEAQQLLETLAASPSLFRSCYSAAAERRGVNDQSTLVEAMQRYGSALAVASSAIGRMRDQFGIRRTLVSLFALSKATEAGTVICNPTGYVTAVARRTGPPAPTVPRAASADHRARAAERARQSGRLGCMLAGEEWRK